MLLPILSSLFNLSMAFFLSLSLFLTFFSKLSSLLKLAAAEGDVKQARQEAEAAIALFLQLNEARHTKKIEEFVSKLAAA